MKKYIILLSVVIVSLLTGCKSKESNENSYAESLSKSQKIEIKMIDSSEIYLIDEKEDIETFIKNIKVDSWELDESPEEMETEREFIFYQKPTKELSDGSKSKNKLIEAAKLITYKDVPYVNFTIENFSLTFQIPEEIGQYLNTLGN